MAGINDIAIDLLGAGRQLSIMDRINQLVERVDALENRVVALNDENAQQADAINDLIVKVGM